jgi:hypothetical protein
MNSGRCCKSHMKFGFPVAPTHYRNLVQLIRDLRAPTRSEVSHKIKVRNHELVIQRSVSGRPVLEQVLPQNWRNGGELKLLPQLPVFYQRLLMWGMPSPTEVCACIASSGSVMVSGTRKL